MSASLVGSEMCIRDRPAACAQVHLLFVRRDVAPCKKRTVWLGQALNRACLLYTSDAADDM
eukprot:12047861-Alexandrium_andersonii.AAC.1